MLDWTNKYCTGDRTHGLAKGNLLQMGDIWGYHTMKIHEIWSVHQRTHCVDVCSCWGTTGKTATATTPSQHPVDSQALYISWLVGIPVNVHNSHFPPAWIHSFVCIVTPNITWTAAIFLRFSRCYRGRRNLAICSACAVPSSLRGGHWWQTSLCCHKPVEARFLMTHQPGFWKCWSIKHIK